MNNINKTNIQFKTEKLLFTIIVVRKRRFNSLINDHLHVNISGLGHKLPQGR